MIKKYLAFMRAAWTLTLEYRAQILIWMMGSLFVVIMLMVWLSISSKGPVGGYSAADFVTYYMVSLFVRQMTAVWASYELDYNIREGRLSPMLLRPIHPIHNDVATNWSEKGLRLIIIVPILVLVFWLVPHTPIPWSVPGVALFLLSLIGAWLIVFLSDYVIGIFCFWTTQAVAFVQTFYFVRMMFSGVIAPLTVFPDSMQTLLHYLPFRYMLSFSTELLMGRLATAEIAQGFATQWAWALCFFVLVRVLWRRALRNYSAVGA
jgi:ABC-2 type transport system permease protein